MKEKLSTGLWVVVWAVSIVGLSGCATRTVVRTETVEVPSDRSYARAIPGAVENVWEEPMVDVVEVPPGLDPEGHYYRPAHQQVQEIRQGRWKYYGDR